MTSEHVGLTSDKIVNRVTIEHVIRIIIEHITLVKKVINIHFRASINIYLIQYMKHDESSTIT